MNLNQLAQSKPEPKNWQAFVEACEEKQPGKIATKNLKRILKKHWPIGSCPFPPEWFEAVGQGKIEAYFALGIDADTHLWAYHKASPMAYRHEMGRGFAFEKNIDLFCKSGLARDLRSFRSCPEGGSKLLREIQNLEKLDYNSFLSREVFCDCILSRPWLSKLRSLAFQQTEMDKGGKEWQELGRKLHKIEELKIHYYRPEADFFRALFAESQARLRTCHFFCMGMPDSDFALFSQKADFSRLEKLWLWGSGPSAKAYEALFERPMPKLRSLHLVSTRTGDGLLSALLQSPFLSQIENLDLKEGHFSKEGLHAFLQSPKLSGLQSLSLQYNPVGDEEAEILAKAPYFGKLKKLNIRECRLTRQGLEALQNSKSLSSLESLAAIHNPGFKEPGMEKSLSSRFRLVLE